MNGGRQEVGGTRAHESPPTDVGDERGLLYSREQYPPLLIRYGSPPAGRAVPARPLLGSGAYLLGPERWQRASRVQHRQTRYTC